MAKKYRKLKKQKLRYKKRRNQGKAIKTILFIILLLALMFLAYSVVDPIKQLLNGELGSSSTPSSSMSDTSSQPGTASETTSEPGTVSSETVSSEPSVETTALKATVMPLATALDAVQRDAFLVAAKEDGYTAVMVELKDENGQVWFQSDAVAALCRNAVAENALSAKELAEKIEAAGMTPIAAVHTFKDKTAPNKAIGNTFMHTDGSSTWWDNSAEKGGKPWLNPHKENARSYNTTVVEELAKAGFAEIVLRSVQFPDITYTPKTDMTGEKTTAEILTQYVEEAAAVAARNGAKVSVSYDSFWYWTEQKIAYGGEASGIQADRLSPMIRLSDYGQKLTIGETVIEDPASNVTAAVQAVLAEIQAKAAGQATQIIPIIASGQDTAAIVQALQVAGIDSYIAE